MSVIGLQAEDTSVASIQQFVEQYKPEHATSISGNDGWLRSSFWQLSAAADSRDWKEQTDVPTILVLREWEDSAAIRGSDVLCEAEAIQDADVSIHERALLMLWKQF